MTYRSSEYLGNPSEKNSWDLELEKLFDREDVVIPHLHTADYSTGEAFVGLIQTERLCSYYSMLALLANALLEKNFGEFKKIFNKGKRTKEFLSYMFRESAEKGVNTKDLVEVFNENERISSVVEFYSKEVDISEVVRLNELCVFHLAKNIFWKYESDFTEGQTYIRKRAEDLGSVKENKEGEIEYRNGHAVLVFFNLKREVAKKTLEFIAPVYDPYEGDTSWVKVKDLKECAYLSGENKKQTLIVGFKRKE